MATKNKKGSAKTKNSKTVKPELPVVEPKDVILQNVNFTILDLLSGPVVWAEIRASTFGTPEDQLGDENWLSSKSYLTRMQNYVKRVKLELEESLGVSNIIVSVRNDEGKIYD